MLVNDLAPNLSAGHVKDMHEAQLDARPDAKRGMTIPAPTSRRRAVMSSTTRVAVASRSIGSISISAIEANI